jgi:hypothetical protein
LERRRFNRRQLRGSRVWCEEVSAVSSSTVSFPWDLAICWGPDIRIPGAYSGPCVEMRPRGSALVLIWFRSLWRVARRTLIFTEVLALR